MAVHLKWAITLPALLLLIATSPCLMAASAGDVVLNEIAWMGTEASTSDEWIELYNTTGVAIDVDSWSIYGADTGECLNFADADGHTTWIVPAHGYLVYANHEDDVNDANGNSIVDVWDTTISMNNSSPGQLILYDNRDCTGHVIDVVNQAMGGWYAGEASPRYVTMERVDPLSPGDIADNWSNNDPLIAHAGTDANLLPIIGTPKVRNSATDTDPIADAGIDQTLLVGAIAHLNGSASSDPEGDPLTYTWAIASRPSGSGACISAPTDVAPTFVVDLPGKYVAELTVCDGYGGTDADSVTVVAQAEPVANFVYSPNDPTVWDTVKFVDHSTDSDGTIDGWVWRFGDGDECGGRAAAHRYLLPGAYTISLEVTDNDGLTSTATGEITVLLGPGDLDGDGAVTVADVRVCQQIALGIIEPTPTQRTQADVDRDGDVDTFDAKILAQYVIGM